MAKVITADMAKPNPDTFASLALPYLDLCYRVALTYCHNPATAEDLVQTAYLKGLQKIASFRTDTNFKAWLLRILHNTWIDELRHRKVVGPIAPVEEQFLPEATPEEKTAWSNAEDLLENFSDQQIIRALRTLPEEQRLTLYLVDVEQLDHEEVAEVLSVAVGTIKSRASRARNVLKEKLEAHAHNLGFIGRRT